MDEDKVDYLLSSKNYVEFLRFVNNPKDKYAIFHPQDRKIIKELTENFEGKDKDNKFKTLVDYANGLYDEKDVFMDKPEVKLRPIIPQPAHFIAKDEKELKNVKVVVLTTNPGYSQRISDDLPKDKIEEQEIMYKTLIGKEKFVPWDIPKKYDEDMEYLEAFADKSWHNKNFITAGDSTKNSFIKHELIEKNDVEQEIMQIEYFSYQTNDSNSIPNQFLKGSLEELLPSQKKNFELLRFMIEKTNAIFVCRNYSRWRKLIQREDTSLFDKFEERAFEFSSSKSFLAITRIRSVSENKKIVEQVNKIKNKAKSKDGDIYIALKKQTKI